MFAHERKPLRSELRNLCLTDCTCRCRVCAGHSVWPGDAAWILECDRADFAGRECCHRRAGDHRAGATHGQSSGQRAWQPPQAGRHSQPRHAGWGCGRIFCGYAGAVCGEEVSGESCQMEGSQCSRFLGKLPLSTSRRLWPSFALRGSEGIFCRLGRQKMAEREGFEPSVALRQRLISSQVPSTTQPPLRIICEAGEYSFRG